MQNIKCIVVCTHWCWVFDILVVVGRQTIRRRHANVLCGIHTLCILHGHVLSCSSLQDTKTLAHKIYTPLKYYTADFNMLPCFGKCTIFTQTPRLSINAISLGLALGNVRHYFTVNATFQHSKESKRKQTSSSSQLRGILTAA